MHALFLQLLCLKFQMLHIQLSPQNQTWRFSLNVTESVLKHTQYCLALYTVACVKFNYSHAVQPLRATLPNWRKHRPGGDPAGTQHWAHRPGQGHKMEHCHPPTPQSHDPDTLGVENDHRRFHRRLGSQGRCHRDAHCIALCSIIHTKFLK